MQTNPTLRRLGFADSDRVVILHADDVGMCQASAAAIADLFEFGLLSSGAVMVPCPWFLQAAEFARAHPAADLGVHLTLTSEHQTYRWGPVSTCDPASGLIDAQGYFHREVRAVWQQAQPEAVQREIEAQVARALAAGMQPTHADTHMGSLGSGRFMLGYVRLAIAARLPGLLVRMDEAGYRAEGLSPEDAARAVGLVHTLDAAGVPTIDYLRRLPLNQPDQRLERATAAMDNLQPGITHFIVHPAKDTPELRAIRPDWPSRAGDYQVMMSEELRVHIRQQGIQVIGYRAIQQLMPDPAGLTF